MCHTNGVHLWVSCGAGETDRPHNAAIDIQIPQYSLKLRNRSEIQGPVCRIHRHLAEQTWQKWIIIFK